MSERELLYMIARRLGWIVFFLMVLVMQTCTLLERTPGP